MIWPFKRKPEGDGPLFGLSPPEGMSFQVRYAGDGGWTVLLDGSEDFIYEQAWGFTTRKAIRKAALKALYKFWEAERARKYNGEYPPKDTRNIQQNPTDGDNDKES